jgi:hypothetical protein
VATEGRLGEGAGVGDDEALVAPVVGAPQGGVEGDLGAEPSEQEVVPAEASQEAVEPGTVESVQSSGVHDQVGIEADQARVPPVGADLRERRAATDRGERVRATRCTAVARSVSVASTSVAPEDRASLWGWDPATRSARRRPSRDPS